MDITRQLDLPEVTIVVPCYNHEKYIHECIESIINQTYPNIELIVIDDGSTDTSPQILEELSKKHEFKYIHRPNKGLCATLNEGIQLATGKYFAACASDDKLIVNKIDDQVRYLESNPHFAMCFGKMIKFDEKGMYEKVNRGYKEGWIFDHLILNHFSIPAVTQMIRKDIFEDIGLYDESLWIEDLDMWLRISNKYQIGYIDDYLAYYRRHETNISRDKSKMLEAQKSIIMKWQHLPNFTKYRSHWEIKWFAYYAQKDTNKAREYLPTIYQNIFDLKVIKYLIRYLITRYFFRR